LIYTEGNKYLFTKKGNSITNKLLEINVNLEFYKNSGDPTNPEAENTSPELATSDGGAFAANIESSDVTELFKTNDLEDIPKCEECLYLPLEYSEGKMHCPNCEWSKQLVNDQKLLSDSDDETSTD